MEGDDETQYPNLGSRLLTTGSWGDTASVAKIGDRVHRPRHANSDFVGRLLTSLEHSGFRAAPRYFGLDEQGRDIMSFIPGATTIHPSERDERSYAAVGRLLRQLHDLTAAMDLASGAECVIHGDPGPYNVVLRNGMPVAFIDWDRARPGNRMTDVAFAVWTWCLGRIGHIEVEDQARRLREFRDAYGISGGDALLRAIISEQRRVATEAEERLLSATKPEEYDPSHLQTIGWATIDREHVERHYDLLLRALQ